MKDLLSCDRLEEVRRHNLCFLCISSRHRASNCSSTRVCDTCSVKNYTLLHGLILEKHEADLSHAQRRRLSIAQPSSLRSE